MKWEGAKHATNACVHFFPPRAMCAMCIFPLVFYGKNNGFAYPRSLFLFLRAIETTEIAPTPLYSPANLFITELTSHSLFLGNCNVWWRNFPWMLLKSEGMLGHKPCWEVWKASKVKCSFSCMLGI